MQMKHIKVTKTARYFILGDTAGQIKQIWFVCHGYGQLGNRFLQKFTGLDNGQALIVAPEGLHRFYLQGFSGEVGASWMTSEDRLSDINDYVEYLDVVYAETLKELYNIPVKINVLGFSQATATVCRWIGHGRSKADSLILWGGPVPEDIDFNRAREIFNSLDLWLVVGNEDPFYQSRALYGSLTLLHRENIEYNLRQFPGGHEFKDDVLFELMQTDL